MRDVNSAHNIRDLLIEDLLTGGEERHQCFRHGVEPRAPGCQYHRPPPAPPLDLEARAAAVAAAAATTRVVHLE